jgi:hypothetical protein
VNGAPAGGVTVTLTVSLTVLVWRLTFSAKVALPCLTVLVEVARRDLPRRISTFRRELAWPIVSEPLIH